MRTSISMIAALLAWGIALAEPPAGTAVIPRSLDIPEGALMAPGKAPELIFLYTGDVMGYIDPCG